jgi:hypothetical protein
MAPLGSKYGIAVNRINVETTKKVDAGRTRASKMSQYDVGDEPRITVRTINSFSPSK